MNAVVLGRLEQILSRGFIAFLIGGLTQVLAVLGTTQGSSDPISGWTLAAAVGAALLMGGEKVFLSGNLVTPAGEKLLTATNEAIQGTAVGNAISANMPTAQEIAALVAAELARLLPPPVVATAIPDPAPAVPPAPNITVIDTSGPTPPPMPIAAAATI